MPKDVSNDPRILMVEHALKKLKDLTLSKKYKPPVNKETTMEAINKLNSSIKSIKFSYTSPEELIDNKMVKEFDLMANQFWDAVVKYNKDIEKLDLIMAELRFIFNILKGLRNRLKLGNDPSVDKALDIIAVKINTVSKLEGKELYLCRVGDGKRIINIITNLKDIKKDTVVPAAILPPVEFAPEISEAMFCSSRDLPEMHEHIGERVNLPENMLKEVSHHIINCLKDI